MDEKLISRFDAVLRRLEEVAACDWEDEGEEVSLILDSVRGILGSESLSPSVTSYDNIVNGQLAKFVEASRSIGGDVNVHAQLVRAVFVEQREFLKKASMYKKPSQSTLDALLQPTSAQVTSIQAFRENNRTSPFFAHLSAISEAIPALGWVTIAPIPAPYIGDMLEAGKFYTNKVLKEYKDKSDSATHKDWVNAFIGTISELQAYVKQYHTTGVEWNKQGMTDIQQGGGAPPTAGGPKITHEANGYSLKQNVGSGSTVPRSLANDATKSEKQSVNAASTAAGHLKNKPLPNPKPATMRSKPITHRLVHDRKSLVSGVSSVPTKGVTTTSRKPPRFELEGNKWLVEYQIGNADLVISDAEMKHAISVFKCEDSVLQVKGKVNTIMLNGCKKMALVFDEVISSVDFVNCQSVQSQVLGCVPTISIDKTDGCLIYLSTKSLDVRIITAKSSEMNILVPDEDNEGEYKEFAVPEQFKTYWDGMKLNTDTSDLTLG